MSDDAPEEVEREEEQPWYARPGPDRPIPCEIGYDDTLTLIQVDTRPIRDELKTDQSRTGYWVVYMRHESLAQNSPFTTEADAIAWRDRPHECHPECPGDINRRKLELFDELADASPWGPGPVEGKVCRYCDIEISFYGNIIRMPSEQSLKLSKGGHKESCAWRRARPVREQSQALLKLEDESRPLPPSP